MARPIKDDYETAAGWLASATHAMAFTGAGISVESGIPPFRGENGLWDRYDPATFDIAYFTRHPDVAWTVMRDIFYELFGQVKPNAAHRILAELEADGLLKGVITQNVDGLHHDAGSRSVHEFHGALRKLVCLGCRRRIHVEKVSLDTLPPGCAGCGGLLKPDAVFFGETIPPHVHRMSTSAALRSDLLILVGTTGEVAPANQIPWQAKENGARIIEVNVAPSAYTGTVVDIFLKGPATEVMTRLKAAVSQCATRGNT